MFLEEIEAVTSASEEAVSADALALEEVEVSEILSGNDSNSNIEKEEFFIDKNSQAYFWCINLLGTIFDTPVPNTTAFALLASLPKEIDSNNLDSSPHFVKLHKNVREYLKKHKVNREAFYPLICGHFSLIINYSKVSDNCVHEKLFLYRENSSDYSIFNVVYKKAVNQEHWLYHDFSEKIYVTDADIDLIKEEKRRVDQLIDQQNTRITLQDQTQSLVTDEIINPVQSLEICVDDPFAIGTITVANTSNFERIGNGARQRQISPRIRLRLMGRPVGNYFISEQNKLRYRSPQGYPRPLQQSLGLVRRNFLGFFRDRLSRIQAWTAAERGELTSVLDRSYSINSAIYLLHLELERQLERIPIEAREQVICYVNKCYETYANTVKQYRINLNAALAQLPNTSPLIPLNTLGREHNSALINMLKTLIKAVRRFNPATPRTPCVPDTPITEVLNNGILVTNDTSLKRLLYETGYDRDSGALMYWSHAVDHSRVLNYLQLIRKSSETLGRIEFTLEQRAWIQFGHWDDIRTGTILSRLTDAVAEADSLNVDIVPLIKRIARQAYLQARNGNWDSLFTDASFVENCITFYNYISAPDTNQDLPRLPQKSSTLRVLDYLKLVGRLTRWFILIFSCKAEDINAFLDLRGNDAFPHSHQDTKPFDYLRSGLATAEANRREEEAQARVRSAGGNFYLFCIHHRIPHFEGGLTELGFCTACSGLAHLLYHISCKMDRQYFRKLPDSKANSTLNSLESTMRSRTSNIRNLLDDLE